MFSNSRNGVTLSEKMLRLCGEFTVYPPADRLLCAWLLSDKLESSHEPCELALSDKLLVRHSHIPVAGAACVCSAVSIAVQPQQPLTPRQLPLPVFVFRGKQQ